MTAALASLAPSDAIAEGRAALSRGDTAEAVRCFLAQAQAQPADHESRYWLYSALVASGEAQAAHETLEQARNLHAVAVIRGAGADMARFQNDKAYCAEIGMQLYGAKLMGAARPTAAAYSESLALVAGT